MPFLKDELISGVFADAVGENYYVSFPYGGRFENVCSIVDVSLTKIVLRLKNGALCVTGENMKINSFCVNDVTIGGKIYCVERVK